MRKSIMLLLLILLHFSSIAGEELLLKQPVTGFLIANLDKNLLRSGTIILLNENITLPDNLDIPLVEARLQGSLKSEKQRQLSDAELSRISALLTDTAMYARYTLIDGDDVGFFCATSNNPTYDVLIVLKGEGGVKISLCLSTTHNYYSFIYADYGLLFYLANTCFNSEAYLPLSELLSQIKQGVR